MLTISRDARKCGTLRRNHIFSNVLGHVWEIRYICGLAAIRQFNLWTLKFQPWLVSGKERKENHHSICTDRFLIYPSDNQSYDDSILRLRSSENGLKWRAKSLYFGLLRRSDMSVHLKITPGTRSRHNGSIQSDKRLTKRYDTANLLVIVRQMSTDQAITLWKIKKAEM